MNLFLKINDSRFNSLRGMDSFLGMGDNSVNGMGDNSLINSLREMGEICKFWRQFAN